MPEIGEVARIVHFLRKNLVGKTLAKVTASVDENVYGKVGTSAEAFEKALRGKKVLDAKQQGKYFWMVMSSPPHPLMHFGMAGWLKFENEDTRYFKGEKPEEMEPWPPKYSKFILETAEEPKARCSFVDFRRFARIRLINCPAAEIRNVSPLMENGPDPVVDKDIFTEEWLTEKLQSKHVPVKALMLDQANISGIGNWVGDEILYDAKIHPEQYSNTLSAVQIKQLHKSIRYICQFAVDNLSDSSKFPEEWLFKHRWGKGKKDSTTTLPNGKRFVYLTVGGRTSCVVPSVQKKTGAVAGDVKQEVKDELAEAESSPKSKKRKSSAREGDEVDGNGVKKSAKKERIKKEVQEEDDLPKTNGHKQATPKSAKGAKAVKKETKSATNTPPKETGRRRSARVSGQGL